MSEARTNKLYGYLRVLARSLGLDASRVKAEWKQVSPAALAARSELIAHVQTTTAGLTAEAQSQDIDNPAGLTAEAQSQHIDNRDCWNEILQSPHVSSCIVLPLLIRMYIAVPLGTPDVERNLGKLTELLQAVSYTHLTLPTICSV